MSGVIGPVHAVVKLICFTVILFTGMSLPRRQTSTEQYFRGRRGMHWPTVGISIQASLDSQATFSKANGRAYC